MPRVHIVLADVDDDPNGFATPLPYPLVGVRAAAPTGADQFGANDGWLRLVLTHELAHVGPSRGGARALPGRARDPRARAVPVPQRGHADLDDRGARHLRGDGGHGLRPRPQPGRADGPAHGRPGGRTSPTSTRPSPGATNIRAGSPRTCSGRRSCATSPSASASATLPELSQVHAGRIIPYLDELTSKRVTGAGFTTRWREWRRRRSGRWRPRRTRIEAAGSPGPLR